MATPEDAVARYYDANTRRFLARGEGGRTGALHRAVWGEGVSDLASAFHFTADLVLREIGASGTSRPRILDLGCGIGATLLHLLARREAEGFGITLSGRQYRLALSRGGAAFFQGDFCRDPLPADLDLAYGIESFVHAADARAFFENVAGALRPGGCLVLVDDFLAAGRSEERWLRDFRWGWHAASLMTASETDRLAASAGLFLSSDRDLTPHIDVDRPRDRVLAALLPAVRPLLPDVPLVRALVGGDALRKCLKIGLIEYRCRVWKKADA
ncbi:MAG TPA: methyltransferase domain-containing protein [Vicinamibacteria bacterium]|nr:methyltransferase domain-containing protein [Vicinamibacteria bacterium]